MSKPSQAFAQVRDPPTTAHQNPLSCEVCRRRKTKCLLHGVVAATMAISHTDPHSPSCTHCIDAKVTCHYPEAKQRGPQVGYLAVLESRLVNTEAVLYDALTKLYHQQQPGDSGSSGEPVDRVVKRLQERYSTMPYSAKTSEWNNQPLLAEDDRQRWFLAHQHIMNDGDSPYASTDERRKRAMSHSSTVDTGEPGFVDERRSRPPFSPAEMRAAAVAEQPLSSNPSPGVNIPATVDPDIAAELDEEQLQKYF
ncbi:hypothetical protein Q7P37_001210 [Cladosporium fusiforme]